jgi:predicted nuclease of predicted toxin-antitoxin system
MIKLVIDMNLSPEWAHLFEEIGWQATHWSKIGASNAPDTEMMAWAKTHFCIVFTHDLDFGALLAASGEHGPSVIQIRHEDTRPETMGQMVITAIQANLADLRNGALVTVHPKRMRTRILPLHPNAP